MAYPSIVTTFSTPSPSDKLSTTPHSSIESAQNTGLTEIMNFIGTESSAAGTLFYDVRAAASNGGGHVQTANKGGTGQTSYTKGDVLIAQSSSVLTKLGIGTNNQVLTADSNQQTGVKWAGVANATDMQNQTYTYARASVMSASVYGVVLSQSPSIISDGLGMLIKFPANNTTSVLALSVHTTSSNSVAALLKRTNLANIPVGGIRASMIGIVTFDSVSSVFQLQNTGTITTNGVLSRAGDAASGSVITAHGLGITPRIIRMNAYKSIATTVAGQSSGTYNDTIACAYMTINGGGVVSGTDTSNIIAIYDDATNAQTATITADATNFTLDWTKTNTPGNANIRIAWEAQS